MCRGQFDRRSVRKMGGELTRFSHFLEIKKRKKSIGDTRPEFSILFSIVLRGWVNMNVIFGSAAPYLPRAAIGGAGHRGLGQRSHHRRRRLRGRAAREREREGEKERERVSQMAVKYSRR